MICTMGKHFIIIFLLLTIVLSADLYSETENLTLVEFSGTLKSIGGEWYMNTGGDFFKLDLPSDEFLQEHKILLEAKAEILIHGILQEEEIAAHKLIFKEEILELRDKDGNPLWSAEVDLGYYEVDPKLCIGCRLCTNICPTGAITMVKGKAVIDADKCIACGFCADGDGKKFKGCPTQAIFKAK